MNIKNILIAGVAIVLVTACSKDKDPVAGDWSDAKLTIGVKASGAITKAAGDPNALEGEMYINNLAVVVFDETGTVLLGKKQEDVNTKDGTAYLIDVPAKATKARIILLANLPSGVLDNVTTYDGFQSMLAELSAQSQANLTMSSQVIVTNNALVADDNYLGYESMGSENINGISSPLEVTRLAARVEIVGLHTNFAGSKLEGRTVRVEDVYIQNQKNASRYFSAGYWGAVVTTGHFGSSSKVTFNSLIDDNNPILTTSYRSYVMENDASEQATQLVVRATLLASQNYEAQTKTFYVTVNADGLANKYDHNFVKRNYIYRLNITFGKNSFEILDGILDVKVEVVGWGPVNQNVEIE
ncbi:fimbrial protein [Parabacteroides sp. GYB001]|uniref:fimbrial protein n=1 Tax=Parabacteroides leei TaxID=2939491 RepID=UPI002016E36E|nr:fimbrial protein [Parabacteroides leei]MCL3850516.1 fimbrial protein [Parabacteroides leei]